MTIPLDTATALSPARSAVVKAFAGSIKIGCWFHSPACLSRQSRRHNQLIDKE